MNLYQIKVMHREMNWQCAAVPTALRLFQKLEHIGALHAHHSVLRDWILEVQEVKVKNIATGETSQAITPYHFFNCSSFFGFYH